ncbi:uncharacterized protein LOC130995211 isoform X2 [Salvia miltiorrhiza]|uniref:uncharacterized protein LOC130995211 isoform X2 n=1 Tax=Salvia miltiorrhiza TaxID=226208 RepID=UPI0025AC1C0B|nr:uncharacterized protein LOC130995211 isoform X2 [Salvia miltiorrhiza]
MTDICFLSYDKDEYPYFSAYSVDEEDGSISPKYYIYPPSPIKQHGIFRGATCNGVFHFMNDHDQHMMWNLTTNECKALPMSFDRRPRLDSPVVASGMWYDHTRENYKLLQFVRNYAIFEEDEADDSIWLYSLKSNSWKTLPRMFSPASTCTNDVFYCGASFGESECIISFNFSTETLSKIHLPLLDKTKCYQIMEYKGLLSIVVYSSMFGTNREPSEYELWVMNDGLWSRESVFHVCGVHEPVWFSRNGRFLYFESFRDEVVVFDRATGKSKNLGIHCYSTRLKIYPLAESFVQLNGVSLVEDLEELVRVEEEEEDDDYGYY